MKQSLITIFILFITVNILALQFDLLSFKELPADFKAQQEPITDDEMNYCSVIKVESEKIDALSFKEKVFEKEKISANEAYFYLSSSNQSLTITADNVEPLHIDLPKVGMNAGTVYSLRLALKEEVELNIAINPKPDRVILNDQIIKNYNLKLLPGDYQLQIEKEGYKTISEEIKVHKQTNTFTYNLAKIEMQPKTVVEKKEETHSEANPSETEEVSTSKLKLERFGVIYEVKSAELFENTLTLNLEITSTKTDQNISIIDYYTKFYTRIIDDKGNEYLPEILKIANNSKRSTIKHDFVQGISTPVELIFKKVNRDMKFIALFDLGIYIKEYDNFRVKYRNIEVTKKD